MYNELMHDLKTWMTEAKETDESLAAKVGVSRAQITRIKNGASGASKETALELERITGIAWHEFIGSISEPRSRPDGAQALQ